MTVTPKGVSLGLVILILVGTLAIPEVQPVWAALLGPVMAILFWVAHAAGVFFALFLFIVFPVFAGGCVHVQLTTPWEDGQIAWRRVACFLIFVAFAVFWSVLIRVIVNQDPWLIVVFRFLSRSSFGGYDSAPLSWSIYAIGTFVLGFLLSYQPWQGLQWRLQQGRQRN